MINFTCPKCNNVADVEDSRAGEAITCPKCGNVNVVLAAEQSAPSTPATPAFPSAQSETPSGETPPIQAPPDKDARMWGMFCHLAALAGFVIPITWGLGWILGPMIVWLIKREAMPFVDKQGKEALNFQISMFIYALVAVVLVFVVVGIFLLIALGLFNLIMVILAAVKASDGKSFRYPLTIRFLK